MIDIESIAKQVRENCEIADARSWGTYSLCTLLLKLRDMYRWERKLKPWESVNHSDVMAWIGEKENRWDLLALHEFRNITIEGRDFSPFNIEEINVHLTPVNLLYGAGYVGTKPTFFLGKIEKKRQEVLKTSGVNIYILNEELARDLLTFPAQLQTDNIICRKEPIRYWLWDRLEEVNARSVKDENALSFAFDSYGLDVARRKMPPSEIEETMENLLNEEAESYIHHEIGEWIERASFGFEWNELITCCSEGKAGHLVRGVKDILADTTDNGMLDHIVSNHKKGSLGFYVSQLKDLRRLLFPEILDSYLEFRKSGDWRHIEVARILGYNKAKGSAERIIRIYKEGKEKGSDWIKSEIEKIL
ncbi:MAG: Sfum_1244 family protein [Nitrospirota bacterium]